MVVIPTVVTLEPQVDSGSLRPVGSAEPGADFFSLFLFSALSSLGEGEGEAPEKSSAQEKSSVLDEPGQTDVLSASQTGATPFVFPFLLFNFSAPAVGAVPPTGQAGDLQVASSQGIDTQPLPQAPPALPEPVPQHGSQLKGKSVFSGPGLGSWVPSPLVGEGQEEGEHGLSTAHGPLSLALSHEGRGDSENKTAGEELKLGLVAPPPLQGDVLQTSSEAVPQVPTEEVRQVQGLPVVDQQPPSLRVITGAEPSAPAPFPSRPPLLSGSPSAEQPSPPPLPPLQVQPAETVQDSGRREGRLAPLPPLQVQPAETERSAPAVPAQRAEQPQVRAGTALTPALQESLEGFSLAAERPSPVQFSPNVTTDLRFQRVRAPGEPEQGDGTAHPLEDAEGKSLGVPLAHVLEAHGRTEGLAAAPLLPAGNGNRPAEDKEDGSALSPRLLTGEGQGQTLRAQSLSTPPATPGAPRPAETWQAVLVQVVGGVSASLRQNSQEARIQLEPPELGKLKIALVLEGGRVHARIIAESAEVGALIQNHLPELKQALQSHSLDLDTVRVDVNSGGGEQGDFSRGFQQDLGARGGRGGPNAFSQWAEKDAEESGSSTRSGSHGSVSVWA